ncbi:MAG: SGNH/GDSL hydrolase family protein [Cyanobacteria bacterium P01_D01_bin.73]
MPLQILPLGDSITDGYGVPGGYRWRLGERLRTAAVEVEFLGSLKNGPKGWSDRRHEGHSGWRIDQIQSKIHGWLAASQPDLILLMIGTNDVVQGFEMDSALMRLETLIKTIFQDCPQVALGVATIPPILDFFPMGENPIGAQLHLEAQAYNDGVRLLVQRLRQEKRNIALAEAYPIFEPSDLPDGVHPNRTGQDKLGELWFQTISEHVL